MNRPPMYANEDGTATMVLCLTDWDYHVGGDPSGVTMYNSVEELRAHKSCADSCGIIEVCIRPVKILAEPTV